MTKNFINISLLSVLAFAVVFSACSQKMSAPSQDESEQFETEQESSSSKSKTSSSSKSSELEQIYEAVSESGIYTTRDSVAAYLCKFGKLPDNYVDKNTGIKLYEDKGNTFSKWNFNPWTTLGVMIGGDVFNNFAYANNYHENLPEGNYHEADVEYSAKNRGTRRLVYQSDCVIYYTADHYETYSKLGFRI